MSHSALQDTAPQDPVRRKNREIVDEAWIRTFLHRAPLCALGTVHDGWPFINANLFFYDEEAHVIYLHTAGSGRTRSNIEADGKVCVSISEMGRLLPGPRATDFSVEYASVIVFGRANVVTDLAEARSAFERQMAKYAKHLLIGRDYEPFTDEEMMRAAMYRIDIERWIAKQNRQPDDFPGAFLYSPDR
ncbi:MAG TPA: pyridoxamine 5'-phosphate oxidase family protein [Thermoanaerobaculia bacterium]|jgi:Predicted flavin-nucleotide-binding protein|nr:pyridoxamine 5'-phosphate oxidase family protein [Thermoanaerobaculia bacterium]